MGNENINNRKVGNSYEKKAADYLNNIGYKIIEYNYSCRFGEVDIILKDKDDCYIFVEVKYRTSISFGLPQEAVTKRKINHIATTALYYFLDKCIKNPVWRIDVIAITEDRIEHLINVTNQ